MKMRTRCDLHIHSTASDGTLEPVEIINKSRELGLKAISITDHDVTDGVLEALSLAKEFDIEVIPGVEINTDVDRKEVHILGYYIDLNNREFQERLARLRNARVERNQKIVAKLEQLGVKIDFRRVLEIAGEGSVGRPHIAMALVEKGYVKSLEKAFDIYLGRHGKAFVERYAISPQQAIRFVLQAKGMPVLAHPGNLRRDEMVPEFISAGLMGIEAYHCDHTPSLVDHYKRLAKKYNLLITGGTDSHGPHSEKSVEIGSLPVPYEVVENLKAAKERLKR